MSAKLWIEGGSRNDLSKPYGGLQGRLQAMGSSNLNNALHQMGGDINNPNFTAENKQFNTINGSSSQLPGSTAFKKVMGTLLG